MKKTGQPDTPLEMALSSTESPPATPIDAFKVARNFWLEGKRITIGGLAKEVGVSRVTIYRWVGSVDRLIEEILWSFAKPTFERAIKETPGSGIEHVLGVHRRFMTDFTSFAPMQHYLLENPIAAIRTQNRNPKSSNGRFIKAIEAHLLEQERQGYIRLPKPAIELAELITYTNGSLLYCSIIGNWPKIAIEHACALTRMILLGQIPANG